jgi:hypothetical protein
LEERGVIRVKGEDEDLTEEDEELEFQAPSILQTEKAYESFSWNSSSCRLLQMDWKAGSLDGSSETRNC